MRARLLRWIAVVGLIATLVMCVRWVLHEPVRRLTPWERYLADSEQLRRVILADPKGVDPDTVLMATELAIKERWTMDDAQVVRRIVRRVDECDPQVIANRDRSKPETFAQLRSLNAANEAVEAATERLRCLGPMDEGVPEFLKAELAQSFQHPVASFRSSVIAAVANAGLLDEPRFMSLVESMVNDPTPFVAEMARLKLAQYKEFKPQWEAFKARRDGKQ